MNTAMQASQRGMTFFGFFIFGAIAMVLVVLPALKLLPSYMENKKIEQHFVAIANDPEMQNAGPREIRDAFSKRTSIDDIKAITPEEIEIAKDGNKLVLSASYFVKIPLAANASLYLDFNPSSAAK